MKTLASTALVAAVVLVQCAQSAAVSLPPPPPFGGGFYAQESANNGFEQQRPMVVPMAGNGRRPPHGSIQGQPSFSTYARFDDEVVSRVEISTLDQLHELEAYVEDANLDLWSNLRIGTVDVRLRRDGLEAFKSAVSAPSTIMIPNLQDLVPSRESLLSEPTKYDYADDSFWLQYHDFDALNNFTETMIAENPDLVKRVSLGTTYEGREIFGLVIHGFKPRKEEDEDDDDNDDDDNDDDEGDDGDDGGDDEDESGRLEKRAFWDLFNKHFGRQVRHKSKHFNDNKHQDPNRHLGKKPSKPKKHPKGILIHGGQHAREWIGPAVVTYIARELIQGYNKNKKITRLVNQFEFTMVPVLNADGYVYTWEHNRMWRKNRQPTSIPFCPGIDPNRNWGYLWNTGGSSSNPCNEGYHGPEAFAALESKMVADYITAKGNTVAYIDMHAYSQLWMSPFGADCTQTPKDDEDIVEAAMGAAKALHDVHGKRFAVGSVCNIIYQASGGSLDWTYAVGGVKYSYAIELRDTGRHGFLLPPEEILPSSEEIAAGVIYLINFIRQREKQWGY